MASVAVFGREAAIWLPSFATWVRNLGPWGPVVFIGGYVIAAVCLMPAFLLTLAAGALWGLTEGLLYAFIGAVAGASCAFLAGRHIVRDLVASYVSRQPKLAAIDRAVEAEGARLVLLLRLSPAVPYVLLNYVLGISRLAFRDHAVGLLGMLPTLAMYVYLGKAVGDVAAIASGTASPRGAAYYVLLAVGGVATVLATVMVTRAARRALADAVP